MYFAPELTRAGRVYLTAVILAGFLVIGESLLELYTHPLGARWLLLAFLTLISGSASIELPRANVSISISEAFVFTAVLLYGPAAGTLTVALDGLVISLWIARRRPQIDRALFNISAPAVSAWCSSRLFFYLSGIKPLTLEAASLDQILPSLIIFAVTYFGLNSWLIAIVIASQKRLSPVTVWRTGFIWLSLNYFCGASVAVLLVGYNRDIDLRFVGVIVPLLLVLYFTFKTSMQRVEDANRHVEDLNNLYLSTIETLAMAIDAKDQITHGHIRRVQRYAVGLAKQIGVRDEKLIKAVEAAALLHDMGKLAVPEYILNKPGKLTPAEFEKMKLHATVGADILSAIEFPYPVVPIVRHHHENWNGTGYPSGLKGTDIPIGARILAVVDCFDALTSDRPYRPRLGDDDAIKILLERRGTMYDPLVVDTFIKVYADIAPEALPTGSPRQALIEITGSAYVPAAIGSSRLEDIAASADEMLTLYELARALGGQASIGDTGDIIAKHLRRLIPATLCIFYIYDSVHDELEAKHAIGEATSVVKGLRIPVGQRLSGWVAANRQTIANSDPTLDLGEAARCVTPRLRSCLSTPLIADDALVGVLTLYSSTVDGFTEDHRRIIEIVARQIGYTFKRAAAFDNSARRDILTGLPDFKQLEDIVDPHGTGNIDYASLIVIDIRRLKQITVTNGRCAGDEVVRHVVRQTRAGLRVADILFRSANDQLIALLSDTDRSTAAAVANRISKSINEKPVIVDGSVIEIDTLVHCMSAPADGRSLNELVTAARLRNLSSSPSDSGPSVH